MSTLLLRFTAYHLRAAVVHATRDRFISRSYASLPHTGNVCRLLAQRPQSHFAPVKSAVCLAESELRGAISAPALLEHARDVPAALLELSRLVGDTQLSTPTRALVARLARLATDATISIGLDRLVEGIRVAVPGKSGEHERPRHVSQLIAAWAAASGGTPTGLLVDVCKRIIPKTTRVCASRRSTALTGLRALRDEWNVRRWTDDDIAAFLNAIALTWRAGVASTGSDGRLPTRHDAFHRADDVHVPLPSALLDEFNAAPGRLTRYDDAQTDFASVVGPAYSLLVAELEGRLSDGLAVATPHTFKRERGRERGRHAAVERASPHYSSNSAIDLLDGLFDVHPSAATNTRPPMEDVTSRLLWVDDMPTHPNGVDAAVAATQALVPGIGCRAVATAVVAVRNMTQATNKIFAMPQHVDSTLAELNRGRQRTISESPMQLRFVGVASAIAAVTSPNARLWRILALAVASAVRTGNIYSSPLSCIVALTAAFGSPRETAVEPALVALRAMYAAVEGITRNGKDAEASDTWLGAASIDELAQLARQLTRADVLIPPPKAARSRGASVFPHVALSRIADASIRLTLAESSISRIKLGKTPWRSEPLDIVSTLDASSDCKAPTAPITRQPASKAALRALLAISASFSRAGVSYAPLTLGIEALTASCMSCVSISRVHPTAPRAVASQRAPLSSQLPLLRAPDLLSLAQSATRSYTGAYSMLVAVADAVAEAAPVAEGSSVHCNGQQTRRGRVQARDPLAPSFADLPSSIQTQFPLYLSTAGVHHGHLLRLLAATYSPKLMQWAEELETSGRDQRQDNANAMRGRPMERPAHTRGDNHSPLDSINRVNTLACCLQTVLISGVWAWEPEFVASLFAYGAALARQRIAAQDSEACNLQLLPNRHINGIAAYVPWRPLHWLALRIASWNDAITRESLAVDVPLHERPRGCTLTCVGTTLPPPPQRLLLPVLAADVDAAFRSGQLSGFGASSGFPALQDAHATDELAIVAAVSRAKRRSFFHSRVLTAANAIGEAQGWGPATPELYVPALNMAFDIAWSSRCIAVEADGPVHYMPLPATQQLARAAALLQHPRSVAECVSSLAAVAPANTAATDSSDATALLTTLPPSPLLETSRAAEILVDPRVLSGWCNSGPFLNIDRAYALSLAARNVGDVDATRPRCMGLPLTSPHASRESIAVNVVESGDGQVNFRTSSSRSNSALMHASLTVHVSTAPRPGDKARDDAAASQGWRVSRISMMQSRASSADLEIVLKEQLSKG